MSQQFWTEELRWSEHSSRVAPMTHAETVRLLREAGERLLTSAPNVAAAHLAHAARLEEEAVRARNLGYAFEPDDDGLEDTALNPHSRAARLLRDAAARIRNRQRRAESADAPSAPLPDPHAVNVPVTVTMTEVLHNAAVESRNDWRTHTEHVLRNGNATAPLILGPSSDPAPWTHGMIPVTYVGEVDIASAPEPPQPSQPSRGIILRERPFELP